MTSKNTDFKKSTWINHQNTEAHAKGEFDSNKYCCIVPKIISQYQGKHMAAINILIARPKETAGELIDTVEALGMHTYLIPSIGIEAISIEQALLEQVRQTAWDKVIFTSQNAVIYGKQILQGLELFQVYAIGSATEKVLKQANIPVVNYPKENPGSDGLLALDEFQAVAHENILIIAGKNPSEKLTMGLTERSAHPQSVCVYQRIEAPASGLKALKVHAEINFDAIVTTSSDVLIGLSLLIKRLRLHSLFQVPVFVVSDKMVQLARYLGFTADIIQTKPETRALGNALQAWYTEHSHQ